MNRVPIVATAATGLIALTMASPAAAQPYQVSMATFSAGGATSIAGGSYTVGCTVGQPLTTGGSGGTYQAGAGFWPATGETCYPDCNANGTLTIADFACFQSRFAAGNLYADCNQSGTLTIADFGCFQSQFAAGCP